MARIPTPLTWKRRTFAVLESRGLVDRLTATAVSGLVAGPFAVYPCAFGRGSSCLDLQACCKDSAERFAALDLNWWTCLPDEVIGPDFQEMKNLHMRLKPDSFVPWVKNK